MSVEGGGCQCDVRGWIGLAAASGKNQTGRATQTDRDETSAEHLSSA
jgi:hypothetical protein